MRFDVFTRWGRRRRRRRRGGGGQMSDRDGVGGIGARGYRFHLLLLAILLHTSTLRWHGSKLNIGHAASFSRPEHPFPCLAVGGGGGGGGGVGDCSALNIYRRFDSLLHLNFLFSTPIFTFFMSLCLDKQSVELKLKHGITAALRRRHDTTQQRPCGACYVKVGRTQTLAIK